MKDFFEQTADIIWTRQVAGITDKYMGGTGYGANGAPVRWDLGVAGIGARLLAGAETILAIPAVIEFPPLVIPAGILIGATIVTEYQVSAEFRRSVIASYRAWLLTSQFHDH